MSVSNLDHTPTIIAKSITQKHERSAQTPLPQRHNGNDRLNEGNQSLEELAKAITERGNDMQVTHSKDGLKVFEVSKKLVKVIRN